MRILQDLRNSKPMIKVNLENTNNNGMLPSPRAAIQNKVLGSLNSLTNSLDLPSPPSNTKFSNSFLNNDDDMDLTSRISRLKNFAK